MKAIISDYYSMTKPRLALLNIVAATSGILMSRVLVDSSYAFLSVVFISLLISGAGALNCVMEVEGDKLMERTMNRPLPSGRISVLGASIFGILLVLIGLLGLYLKVNALTFWLGILSVVSYVFMYTPMKRKSHLAVYVGAIPGALPPVLGYTSVTNNLDLMGITLFLILFFWQISHFLAISIYQSKDYAKGKIFVYPNIKGIDHTRIVMILFAALTCVAGIFPYFIGYSNSIFLIIGLLLGLGFLYINSKNIKNLINDVGEINHWAKKCFFASIIYLPLLFGFMIIF